jgi:hypothetical protein
MNKLYALICGIVLRNFLEEIEEGHNQEQSFLFTMTDDIDKKAYKLNKIQALCLRLINLVNGLKPITIELDNQRLHIVLLYE